MRKKEADQRTCERRSALTCELPAGDETTPLRGGALGEQRRRDADLAAGLRDGTLDFAIAIVDETKISGEFQFRPLLEAELIISARKDHSLTHAQSIYDLEDAEWMLNTTPESIGRVLQDYFVSMGASAPRVVVECSSFSGSFSLASNSDFLSCCPKSFVESGWFGQQVIALPVREPLPRVAVGIISRRDALNTAACDYLIDCFCEAVSNAPLFDHDQTDNND